MKLKIEKHPKKHKTIYKCKQGPKVSKKVQKITKIRLKVFEALRNWIKINKVYSIRVEPLKSVINNNLIKLLIKAQ